MSPIDTCGVACADPDCNCPCHDPFGDVAIHHSAEGERVLSERWYVMLNDLIGGWTVANQDCQAASELECKVGGGREIADCWDEEVAHHIAAVHNSSLVECARCQGHGFIEGRECPDCGGGGAKQDLKNDA